MMLYVLVSLSVIFILTWKLQTKCYKLEEYIRHCTTLKFLIETKQREIDVLNDIIDDLRGG